MSTPEAKDPDFRPPSSQTSRIIMRVGADARTLVQRLQRLIEIGTALSAERDVVSILETILKEGRNLTGADSGSIYIREDERTPTPNPTAVDALYRTTPFLVLKIAQNDSITFPFKEIRLPFDASSVAGYVATTNSVISAKDLYRMPEGTPYKISRAFDEKTGYRSKSMLVMPMRDRDGQVVGVLQLINKKVDARIQVTSEEAARKYVIPFDEVDEELLESLASQAAVCIEKTKLYDAIERLFDGFVYSLTVALEKRNRTTHGHCIRVARYAEAIARAINETDRPPFKDVKYTETQLREIRVAALLHDIGKLAVREAVLDKQNKLTDDRLEAIHWRFAFAGRPKEEIDFVARVNIPRGMTPEDAERLKQIAAVKFRDVDGQEKPLLTEFEVENLAIARGNLTVAERKEIERHIVDTWEILRRIDWPKDLSRVPHLAASHHEKLDGKGYPWGITGQKLDVAMRILPIVDIFEALTAKDRPYKPPMPVPKAIAILEDEVKQGKLDADIVKLFVEKGLTNIYSDETGKVKVPDSGGKG